MLKYCFTLLLALSAACGSAARAESVLFLSPGGTNETFWVTYAQFMRAAADDLGIDFAGALQRTHAGIDRGASP